LKKSNMTTATIMLWWKCCGRRPHFPVVKPRTDSHWNRKPVSLVSWVTADILQPNSCISSTARWFHVPAVSTATRTNILLLIYYIDEDSVNIATTCNNVPSAMRFHFQCC